MVQKTVEATQLLNLPNNIVEIIDLRTLNPIDMNIIESSVKKTSKVLVVHEDNMTNGPGAEISALIVDKYFQLLDAPVRRVAAKDSPVPFNWILEEKVLPQSQEIADVIEEILEY